ncbi:MAG: FG-GAP repeat domain-containing protein, partial [Chloroflexota bacterium]
MELVRSRRNRRLGRMAVLAAGATLLVPIVTTGAAASGTPVFGGYQATSIGSSADAVAIGDVTGDGRQDVVMTSEYSGNDATDFRLLVFAQTPDGTLAAPVSYPTAASYTNRPDSVAVGDVTGDGRGDVVVAVAGLGIQLFPQVASGQLGDPTFYNTPDSNKLRIGKLDADGVLDVASIGWGTNTVSVFDGDGIGGLASPDVYAVQHGGFDDLEIADVTGDSRDDIVVMSGQTYAVPNVSVLAQTPGGTFTAAAEYSVAPNTNTSGIGVGDITGDGRTDVVAAYGGNRPASHLAVFAQTSTGMLAAPVSYASYDIPTPVEVADVDRDGHADVVTLHSGWARAGLYRGLASGGLDAEELYPLASFASYNPHGLAVGDITGDGWPDLAIASRDDGLVILRNNGSTPPPPPTPTPPPSPTATPTAPPSITPKPVSAPSAPTLL